MDKSDTSNGRVAMTRGTQLSPDHQGVGASRSVFVQQQKAEGRVEADITRARTKVALKEGSGIMADIRALQGQLDQHGVPQQEGAA